MSWVRILLKTGVQGGLGTINPVMIISKSHHLILVGPSAIGFIRVFPLCKIPLLGSPLYY